VQALAAAGVGVALVPRMTVEADDRSTRVIDLPKLPPRVISIAWHRDRYRGRAAQAFAETAQTVCAELEPEAAAA